MDLCVAYALSSPCAVTADGVECSWYMDSRGYDIAVCASDVSDSEERLHHMVQTYVEATASEVRTDRGVMYDSFAAAGSSRLT